MPTEFDNDDLWPDLSPSAIVTPASILKTQAAALSRRTKGLLRGEVRTWGSQDNIYHAFMLVAPALDDYSYSLFRIHHKVTPVYPVYVDEIPIGSADDGSLMAELNAAGVNRIPDEDAFRAWLRKTFADAETKRIVESLLAQAAA